ncbi:unnamed protein product, partial [Coregonus sp. 'balchen']
MATGAVYSTPARPLPRNTLSRGAFKFKKSPKHCSWRCTALSAVGVAVLLSIILCYCIAMHFFGLNWQLQETENKPAFENGGGKAFPTQPSILHLSVLFFSPPGRTGAVHQENNSIDTGQVEVGRRVGQGIPPGVFWRSRLAMEQPRFLKFNISVQKNALVGAYGRKGLPPSHTQYDFVELLDGSRLIAKEMWAPTAPETRGRMERQVSLHQAGFIQYLDSGVWHLAFYNDGKSPETVSYNTIILGKHNMEIIGNGRYTRGHCQCYSGWKGTECDVPTTQCVDPQCGGHGICVTGNCVCNAGHKGSNCHQVDCLDPTCSGHGACHHSECHCNPGWGGIGCEILKSTCPEQCSSHGTFHTETGTCVCEANWTGSDCSFEVCTVDCGPHGVCVSGTCHCEEGWAGSECDQRDCHPRCTDHGVCREGKCDCHQGWTGEHCTIVCVIDMIVLADGCPGLCNSNGRCVLDQAGWRCICQSGWRGLGCDVATETLCSDGKDNEGDGLVDCMDPDCCSQSSCQGQPYCRGSPDPTSIVGQGQGSSSTQSAPRGFYAHVSFLVRPGGSHVIPGDNPFNSSLASIIRGLVLTGDGTPLIGVNVSFRDYPEYGYTITRQDGMFDLLANGGASLTLSLKRAPFPTLHRTVWLPWKVFHVMDTVVMKREDNDIPSCYLSGLLRPSPIILASPLSTFYRSSPEDSPIIPETQVLHEEVAIPGSDLNLVYLSSRTSGYKPILKVLMTQERLPFGLMMVHLMIAVMGRLFQKSFPSFPDLSYTFVWDKTDAYNQKVYGLSEAVVSVGYEYESCLDMILWEKRTAILQGYELDASNMGGWMLDKHHILDIQNGKTFFTRINGDAVCVFVCVCGCRMEASWTGGLYPQMQH